MRFGNLDSRSVIVARAFFHAATKLSDDDEDILPQEDSADVKLSVYGLFSELFPEHAVSKECGSITAKTGLTRLQFNKLGYEMYVKEQSRRVPAPRAKPGNPGYGFRRAKWRNMSSGGEDQRAMQDTLMAIGLPRARCDYVRMRIEQYRLAWEQARRPSRPAGPGRPRGRARGDKAEGQSPEPVESLVDGAPRSIPGLGTLGSPMMDSQGLLDGTALQYVKQIEHMAALQAALGRSHQHGAGALLPAGLLPQQHPPAPAMHQMMHNVPVPSSAGVTKPLLINGLGTCAPWLGGGHSQQPSIPGLNLGLTPAAGTSGTMRFAVDALKQLEQQPQRLAAGGAALASPSRSAELETTGLDAAIADGRGHMPWAGPSSGHGLVGGGRRAGGLGGSLTACGGLLELPRTVQAPWQACARATPLQVQRAGVSGSKRWKSEDGEGDEDDGQADQDAACASAAPRRPRAVKRAKSAAGCSAGAAAAEVSGGEVEKGIATTDSANFPRAICIKDDSASTEAPTSSASTSVANSPADRALDKIEQEENSAPDTRSCANKASLINLLTGLG